MGVNESSLLMGIQPGDVLLFRATSSSNLLDRLICWGQRIIHAAPSDADYFHVGIVGNDVNHFYQAVWPKIANTVLDCTTINKTTIIEVYRVKGITVGQVQAVMATAQSRVGEWYDVLAILTFGMIQLGHTAVCSQYVWQCFLNAGLVLCPFEALESPDDIAASSLLQRVT